MSLDKKLNASCKFQTHLKTSIAVSAVNIPALSVLETRTAGVPDMASLDARLFGAGLLFGGVGYFFGKLREISSNTTNMTKGIKKRIHDSIFTAGVYASLTPPVYTFLGINNREQIIDVTISIGSYGLFAGILTGYMIDLFNNKDTEKSFKSMTLAITLSALLTITNYELTPEQSFEIARENLERKRNEKIALICAKYNKDSLFQASEASMMCYNHVF
jgi:hypothetical protein